MKPFHALLTISSLSALLLACPADCRAQSIAPVATVTVASVPVDVGKHKGKKDEYTGPTEIVELPPTPMLDEEGKQRLDPDSKPMFNPPLKQQRDKKGHPLFDEGGKPVFQAANELGYDEKGKKLHAEKVKTPKMTPVSISRGALSVDGMTGRAALNYEIKDFKYLYLFAPGIGIAVVSNEPFPGAKPQAKGFNGPNLMVNVGEHTLALASDKILLAKGIKPAYVLVDRQFRLPSGSPESGYGTTLKAPYAWPGAKPNTELAGVAAPPVPVNMLPMQLLKPCPSGQMRRAAPKALPGQVAPDQPCVAIPAVRAQSIPMPTAVPLTQTKE